jgi:hypothetical protein
MKSHAALSLLILSLVIPGAVASAAPFEAAQAEVHPVFKDKPYSVDLREIASLDPKPLKIVEFAPDPDKKVQGVRIFSGGRIFPFSYEVITFPTSLDPVDALGKIIAPLAKREDIVVLENGKSEYLGVVIYFDQRSSENGKPHHVSSNWIFVRDKMVYHVIATNYAATIMRRESWGEPKPDPNAREEAMRLLRSLRSK